MNNHTVIGVDLAKTVFQVAIMANGKLISNKQVRRASLHSLMVNQPPSIVAMEHAIHHIIGRASSNAMAMT